MYRLKITIPNSIKDSGIEVIGSLNDIGRIYFAFRERYLSNPTINSIAVSVLEISTGSHIDISKGWNYPRYTDKSVIEHNVEKEN